MEINLGSQVWGFRLDSGCQCFSICAAGTAAAVSPYNLLERQILGSHPRPTESGILGFVPPR